MAILSESHSYPETDDFTCCKKCGIIENDGKCPVCDREFRSYREVAELVRDVDISEVDEG